MTATFLLPFAIGACTAVGGNVVTDAFGLVALVAMTPLIAIQILGLVYKLKSRKSQPELEQTVEEAEIIEIENNVDEDIIDL
jgi:membrane protein implicated in regulation of membrane protease activity